MTGERPAGRALLAGRPCLRFLPRVWGACCALPFCAVAPTHPPTCLCPRDRSYGDTPAAYFWLMDNVHTDLALPDDLAPLFKDGTVPSEAPGEL